MTRAAFRFAITITLLLASQAAHGRSEYRLGGEDGNPWLEVLSGGGQYLNIEGQNVSSQVPVSVTLFGDPVTKLAVFNATSVLPLHIAPDANLVLADIRENSSLMPLPLTGGWINTDLICFTSANDRRQVAPMFDGDPTTAYFFVLGRRLMAPTIDFGGELPVNRFRFYPRLGRHDDQDLIQSLAEPSYPETAFPTYSFIQNLLSGYDIRVGADNLPFVPNSCHDLLPGMRWLRRNDPDMEVVAKTVENLDTVVDLTFPTRYVRWMSFEPQPKDQWEIAEFEVFGEGFVHEAVYRTPILDFGKRVNWSKIRWSGEFPFGTQTQIRTRTGNTPDPNLYFDIDVNGAPFPISREGYEFMNVLLRQPVQYDTDNWSFWTPPYEIETGRRDSTLAPEAWQDATRMISFGSSRYLQLEVKLISRFAAAPRLDQIAIQFSENPVAQDVVAEIWPTEVSSFEANTFTYVVKPTFEVDDTGFDRLEILTHATADTVRSVKVDDRDIDMTLFQPRIEEDRILVAFPFRQADPDSNRKRIEVIFDVEVLRFGTQFTGWIYDSTDPDPVKQRVQAGNADFRFASDALSVSTPIGGDLLADRVVAPNPFTPNGDGVNDRTVISYKLREVMAAREVALEIYDLAGTLVFRRVADPATHGERQLTWNGRTNAGNLVVPGSYLYRLRLDAADEEVQLGVIAVTY